VIILDNDVNEMHTLLGKIFLQNKIILDNDVNEMHTHLRKAILQDKNNYSRVLIDPMYKNVKPDVLGLLCEILRETQSKTEKELSSVESNFNKYTGLLNSLKLPESTAKMIENTKSEIIEIKRKMKNNSYFDYLDSLDMITNINSRLIKVRGEIIEFRRSSENNLKCFDTNLRNTNLHLNETYKQLKALQSLRLFNTNIAILSLFFLCIAYITIKDDLWIVSLISLMLVCVGVGIVTSELAGTLDSTISNRLIEYTVRGIFFIIALLVLFVVLSVIDYISDISESLFIAIFNLVLLVMAIPFINLLRIVMFRPDTNISKKKSIINDYKSNINDIESAINENKLILSTLKSF